MRGSLSVARHGEQSCRSAACREFWKVTSHQLIAPQKLPTHSTSSYTSVSRVQQFRPRSRPCWACRPRRHNHRGGREDRSPPARSEIGDAAGSVGCAASGPGADPGSGGQAERRHHRSRVPAGDQSAGLHGPAARRFTQRSNNNREPRNTRRENHGSDSCTSGPDRNYWDAAFIRQFSDPDVSRPRLIRDASFLEADRREIALRRGRHNRLGFAYQVAFVRVLGRRKNVILYGEIKIDPAKLKMRDP